jgi:hypothetical protein
MPHTTRRHGMREHRGVLVTVARLLGLLCSLPDALPSEQDARASIALTLEQLQTGDLPFHRAV